MIHLALLENSTGAPHGEEDGRIALASNNSSIFFLISNNSWGLCLYKNFHMGLTPSSIGILCISPSFQLGGARVGSVPGNTLQYLHNIIHNNVLYFSSTLSKCGIALPLKDPYPNIKYLVKIVQGFWMFLIIYHM